MKIFNSLNDINIAGKTAIALGNFDGLHIGHRKVMECAISHAESEGLESLCFTFSNHPFNFIMRRSEEDPDAVKLICSEDEKILQIKEMGFDILLNVPFDEDIMTMSADRFFSEIIKCRLNAGHVSAGFNYSYGARATGNSDTLRDSCIENGIGCIIHDAVTKDGEIVSSTLIRQKIAEGDMEAVSKYLGREYSFRGIVEHGRKLGTAMGIPTVNIPVPPEIMLPPNGVYFSRTLIDGRAYNSISNLGTKPTIETYSDIKSVETNIFDYDGDLYGREVTVLFDHFSRPETRFESKEELFTQIRRDCINAKSYYDHHI